LLLLLRTDGKRSAFLKNAERFCFEAGTFVSGSRPSLDLCVAVQRQDAGGPFGLSTALHPPAHIPDMHRWMSLVDKPKSSAILNHLKHDLTLGL
jgi:hypothetical protein